MIKQAGQLNHRDIGRAIGCGDDGVVYHGKLMNFTNYGHSIEVEIKVTSTWTQKVRVSIDHDVEVR